MTAATVPVYKRVPYDRHKSSRKSLTPREFVGKLFVKYFNHGWSYIYAVMPKEEKGAKWYTKKGYPLDLRNLWSLYKNKGKLLGLRFGADTNYFLFDFDRWGEYHPCENEEKFKEVLGILEEIGLCRPIVIRSSDSGGLHVYYFLPRHVHSFTLAATIERVLADRGHFLQKGHLEVFPNPKPYNKSRITNFNGHRLPLQPKSGSYLLDFDYEPVSADIGVFLKQAEFTSSLQDMESLSEAMTVTDRWYKRQFIYGRRRGEKKMSGAEFRFDLQEVIEEGWSGRGQTNDLLLKMAAFGVVFLALSGERLVDYIVKTAINSPGYTQYCGHQHEIDKRARDVAKSAENFSYLPYCNYPKRDISYTEHFYGRGREDKKANNKDSNVVLFPKSRERHEETVERVAEIVAILKAEGAFPEGICKREKAIRAKSIEMYGVGGSSTTLRKAEYLPLWHPLHEHKYKDETKQEGGSEKLVGGQANQQEMLVEGEEIPEKSIEAGVEVENENTDCLGEQVEQGQEIVDTRDSKEIAEVINSDCSEVIGETVGEIVEETVAEVVEEVAEEIVEEKGKIEEGSEGVNSDSSVAIVENKSIEAQEPEALQCKDSSELQVHFETQSLEARQGEGFGELHVLSIYEGIFVPAKQGEAERSEQLIQEENLANLSEDRVLLILLYSIVLQIFESITGAEINSNSSDFIIEANEAEIYDPELINGLQALIDKCFLYSASVQKSPKVDKFCLLMFKILEFWTAKLALQPISTSVKHFEPPLKPCNTSCGENTGLGIDGAEPVLYASNNSQQQQEVSGDKQNCDCQDWQGGDDGDTRDDLSRLQVPSQVPLANQQLQVAPTQSQDAHATSEEILPQQWQEVHFKLKAPREAKRLLNIFCNEQGEDITASVSRKREILEQFLRYCLMWRSPFEALRREAREWFIASKELITQIEGFTLFWEYFGELVF